MQRVHADQAHSFEDPGVASLKSETITLSVVSHADAKATPLPSAEGARPHLQARIAAASETQRGKDHTPAAKQTTFTHYPLVACPSARM